MKTSINPHQISCGVLAIILFAAGVMAQETQRTDTVEGGESTKDTRRQTKSEPSRSSVSFTDSLLLGMGNNATLSFGLYEGYNSDILSSIGNTSAVRRPDSITSLYSRFFARAERRTTQFSIDYASGYRFYAQTSEFNGPEHRGTVAFRFQPSRRSWVEISEYVASLSNDSHALLSQPLAPTDLGTEFSQQVLLERQRVFTNVAKAELGLKLDRRSQLSVYGSHVIQRFHASPSHDADGFLLGLHFQRQFNRWLAFETRYQFKLSEFNNQFGQANVHRFDIGGFNYRLQPTVTLFASGGVEYAEFQETYHPGAAFRGGIAKQTRTTNLALEYRRGFTSGLGLGTLAQGDAVALRLNRRITSWLNLLASSIYSRNSAFTGPDQASGPLHIFQAQPGLQFAVRRNLIFSVTYDYFSQNTHNLELTSQKSSRHYITFGFEYVLGAGS